MVLIKHNLLPNKRKQKEDLIAEINLFSYTQELYNELEAKNIITRMKEVPQLGLIKVKKNLIKYRYDYVILQLYLHKIVQMNLNSELKLSYSNPVDTNVFASESIKIKKKDRPSIGELLQILTIVYNIGHFHNTFTSSKAVLIFANKNREFKDNLIKSSKDPRFQKAAEKYIEENNYHRIHLLNSILILERCNQELRSVKLAQELLYAYMDKESLDSDNKLYYIFKLFKKVRDLAYIGYDLQIAKTPFIIDLCDKEALIVILRELLSLYNDQKPVEELFKSTSKILNDTLYNKKSDSICNYQIAKKMFRDLDRSNYVDYYDLWLDKDSILNKKYHRKRDHDDEQILKLTFKDHELDIADKLLYKLDHTDHVRVGYYNRYSGEKTILIAISKNCKDKKSIAFKVLSIVISYLSRIDSIKESDSRFLLASKFFLYYFFSEKRIHLEATIDEEICVLCTRGSTSRIRALDKLLANKLGTRDEQYEVEFMRSRLKEDNKNDTTITAPSSVLVLEKDKRASEICEFDGLIIHPNREKNQIILLEAKNTSKNLSFAEKCLIEKLDKLNFDYNRSDIITEYYNAFIEITI